MPQSPVTTRNWSDRLQAQLENSSPWCCLLSLLWLMSTGHVYPSWLQLIGCPVWSMDTPVILCSAVTLLCYQGFQLEDVHRLEAKHKPIISKSPEFGIRRHSSLPLISCVALSSVPHLSLAFRLLGVKWQWISRFPGLFHLWPSLFLRLSQSIVGRKAVCTQLQGKVSCTTGWRWAKILFWGSGCIYYYTQVSYQKHQGQEDSCLKEWMEWYE